MTLVQFNNISYFYAFYIFYVLFVGPFVIFYKRVMETDKQ